MDNFIRKYGEEEGALKFNEYTKNRNSGYSKISQKVFEYLYELLIVDFPNINKDKIYFLPKTKEFRIVDKKIYYYDFVITDNINICIEFNGDIFHANPLIYKEFDKPMYWWNDKLSKDIWEYDKQKKQSILNRGFKTFIIWESDIKNNFKNYLDNFYKKIKEIVNESNKM